MNRFQKILALMGVGMVLTVALTACGATENDLPGARHKIIELETGLFEGREWIYEDAHGNRRELSVNCSDGGWFSKYCRETEDGVVKFRWSVSKSSIVSEEIIVDGSLIPTDCFRTDGGWGSYICIPFGE